MNTAAELRREIESALAGRIPAALSRRSVTLSELVSSGVAEVDATLGGGLPLGGITELTGPDSSGRTTLALATLAHLTQQGNTCAYIDVSDSFDPVSASAAGVNLRCLLWVRTGEVDAAAVSSPFSTAAPAMPVAQEKPVGGGWRHPRTETQVMDRAVGELFHGQQGASRNFSSESSDFTPRCSESIRRKRIDPVVFTPQPPHPCTPDIQVQQKSPRKKPWSRLDQALRATDLLLNTGGFRVVVLDMGDIRAEHARRVPLATWYRFRLQVEKSQTLFLLLTRIACANSCAAVSLCCDTAMSSWNQAVERSSWLLAGLRYRVSLERMRAVDPFRKKPVSSAQTVWSSTTTWSR